MKTMSVKTRAERLAARIRENRARGGRTGGFTLVELIVVIAILAILAGVGTVGYSGYVKKAHQAADEQLLGYINSSFAAACLENSVDAVNISDATLAYATQANGDTAIIGIRSVAAPAGNDIKAAFDKYFSGNSGELKYYEQGDIVFYNGVFTGDPDAVMDKAVSNYKESNFNGYEAELLTAVENVTGAFTEFLGNESDPLSNRLNVLSRLNVDTEAFVKKYGLTDASTNQAIANALVLEAASQSKNIDPYEFYNDMMSGGNISSIMDDPVAKLPLMYGMVTAYAKSNYATQEFKNYYAGADLSAGLNNDEDEEGNVTDSDSLMTLFEKFMSDGGLADYAQTEALTDMNGYLGAMTAISQNSDSVDINQENAFTNAEIQALVSAILGNGN